MGYNFRLTSNKAIKDTKINLEWIKNNYQLSITNYELKNIDVTQISKQIKPNSIDAIITEPYLGPQRGKFDINKTVKELEHLYTKSLVEFKKILKPNGKIIMIWPSFSVKPKSIFINPDIFDYKIINPMPKNLEKNIFLKLTMRNTMVYGREDQKVWREIVVLQKTQ